jgi:hypothetical protein
MMAKWSGRGAQVNASEHASLGERAPLAHTHRHRRLDNANDE